MRALLACVALVMGVVPLVSAPDAVDVVIDVARQRHPIDPRIYGMAFADRDALATLRPTVNRWGGNATSRYNWETNATNRASDWFFESISEGEAVPGAAVDSFVRTSKTGNAEPLITVPALDWVARVGPGRSKLASFSVAKYGPQMAVDAPWFKDAGNGVSASTGEPITGNDPRDAHVASNPGVQQKWLRHLVQRWGSARHGGVRYYMVDNEPSLWHHTHRDVHPAPAKMDEILERFLAYGGAVKSVDPDATVLGPEEWGWLGLKYSGFDQQSGAETHWLVMPDRLTHGNRDFLPWFLEQVAVHDRRAGRRTLDMLTVHYYPMGGEYSTDVTPAMQARRHRSTRSLWDSKYVDESWIGDTVQLIPRLRAWVDEFYPGTKIGITEYNWGAEGHMNGATTQADLLGLFGREGLDLASYWSTPPKGSPVYFAFQMYRNYDGKSSSFGETSVLTAAPQSDELSVFAAQRNSDQALTIMLVNKVIGRSTTVKLCVANFASARADVWQLADNVLAPRPTVPIRDSNVSLILPPQSVTLLVLPRDGTATAAAWSHAC